MILEAVASGLPVITLNQAPMNEWVRQPELLARPLASRYPAYSSAWVEHSHLRLPDITDLASRIAWTAEHDLETISRKNRSWAEELFDPLALYAQWEASLDLVYRMPAKKLEHPLPEPPPPCLRFGNRIRQLATKIIGRPLPLFGVRL